MAWPSPWAPTADSSVSYIVYMFIWYHLIEITCVTSPGWSLVCLSSSTALPFPFLLYLSPSSFSSMLGTNLRAMLCRSPTTVFQLQPWYPFPRASSENELVSWLLLQETFHVYPPPQPRVLGYSSCLANSNVLVTSHFSHSAVSSFRG